MYANLSTSIEINDKEQPKYNEYINNEYELREQARQLLKSRLISAGIEFARNANSEAFEEFYRYMSINIPKEPEPSWTHKAIEDAKDLIREYFIDEIVQQLIDGSEVSSDMYNDYTDGDQTFNETIIDRSYGRTEAMELLDELYEYEEDDSGIWEGLNWEEVIQAKAAYTYGNAVYSKWNDIISNINDINPENLDVTFVTEHFKTTYEDEWNTKFEAALRVYVLEEL